MSNITSQNFGLMIAYVIPGFVALWGIGLVFPPLNAWLDGSWAASADPNTVGGFLYVFITSIASGITVSTVRWLIIDRIHHWTGLTRPAWDDAKLQDKLAAFEALVDNHYRYYQFYANALVALLVVFVGRKVNSGHFCGLDRFDDGMLFLFLIYWAGSRSTLRNYYTRAAFLLGTHERTVCNDERTLLRNGRSRPRKAGAGTKAGADSARSRKAGRAAEPEDD